MTSSEPQDAQSTLTVLLIGNYEADRQESMQRFANVLASDLVKRGVHVETCRPAPIFGRLAPSASGVGKWLGYIDKFLLFPFFLMQRTRRMRDNARNKNEQFIVHICDHSNAIYTRYLRGIGHLVTCNDMLAIRSARSEIKENATRWSGKILQAMILRGLDQAQAVACISEATCTDLLRLSALPMDRVSVIHMGHNYPYHPLPHTEAESVTWGVSGDGNGPTPLPPGFSFILHVGGNQWYKNRIGVLGIYAAMRKQAAVDNLTVLPKLIMVGPPLTPAMGRIFDENPGLCDDVVCVQNVPNEQLRALYSSAEVLLFPSLEEGFGWPIIEAHACGCRVVTTGKTPMTEVGGNASVYLDPVWLEDEEGLQLAAKAVRDLLDEASPEREKRIAEGLRNAARFSTEKMIREYVCLYRRLAA